MKKMKMKMKTERPPHDDWFQVTDVETLRAAVQIPFKYPQNSGKTSSSDSSRSSRQRPVTSIHEISAIVGVSVLPQHIHPLTPFGRGGDKVFWGVQCTPPKKKMPPNEAVAIIIVVFGCLNALNTFKLDTGADVTVVSQAVFNNIFSNAKQPVLQKAEKPLFGPGQITLDVSGFVSLQLRIGGKQITEKHREESAEVAWASVSGCPLEASLGRCSRHVPPGGGLEEDPGHAGETMPLGWPGNASGSPRKRWRKCLRGEGSLGISAQTAASTCDP
ncbi:hypothetical protein L3Q82_020244, partial [Scortum barcoo]